VLCVGEKKESERAEGTTKRGGIYEERACHRGGQFTGGKEADRYFNL